jgi:FdhE protein
MAEPAAAFERLVATDPVVAPLARLQAAALAASEAPEWEQAAPQFDPERAHPTAPLLHGLTLTVDEPRQRALLAALVDALDRSLPVEAGRLSALLEAAELGPLQLLQAALTQDDGALEAFAERAEVDPGPLTVVAQTATLPLLAACGRRAAARIGAETWPHGYCPLCAAWPTLAEVRGLTRDFVLRCGRCGLGWQFEHWCCPFCGSRDHASQSYFAAEQERETRRAVVCDACHGYFKTHATLAPLPLADLLLRDLESLELDLAAQQQGYRRPDAPGWGLALRVEAAPRRAGPRLRWW